MNRVVALSLTAIFMVAFAGCGEAPETVAQPALNSLTPQEQSAGWVLLFDGETLDGWEDPSRETPPGDSWVVEDGCIKSVASPRLREDLFTNDAYGDFELSFDWKITPDGNSGVKYRVQDRAVLIQGKLNPDTKRFEDTVDYELINRLGDRSAVGPDETFEEYVVAFEYQVIDDHGRTDARRGPDRASGAIYSMVAASEQTVRPVGEFNEARIVLRGNHIEHWLNGVKVVDSELDAEQIRAGLEKRWTKESPVYRLLTEQPKKETPIGLQHHNDTAWYRNIKIRPL